MTEDDRKQFALAVGAMLESFGHEATQGMLHGYWLGMNDIELGLVQIAVARAIRECERLPKPAELRKLTGEHTKESRSVAAWGDVQRALPIGPYKHINFQDKLINAVIRNLGGWPNFVSRFTDAEAEKWVRLEFIKCYESLAHSGVNGEMCEPLIGLSQVEGRNGEVGKPIPRLIECDPERQKRLEVRQNPFSVARLA